VLGRRGGSGLRYDIVETCRRRKASIITELASAQQSRVAYGAPKWPYIAAVQRMISTR
jgi:hypothetical protein